MDDGPERGVRDASGDHLAALQDLTAAMSDTGAPFQEQVERVLEVGREHLGYADGFLGLVDRPEWQVVASVSDSEDLAPGSRYPLEETYCRHALSEEGVHVVADASESMAGDPAYDYFGLESYVGVELSVDETTYGTLCFADGDRAHGPLTDWQRTLFEHLASWIEGELDRERSNRLLEATFNSPNLFVGVLNPDGTVRRANETALAFVDAEPSAVRGVPIHETPWWNHDDEQMRNCRAAIERAADGERVDFEGWHVGADGERIRTAVTARPVYSDGRLTEIVVEGLDVTDLKRRKEQLEFFNSALRHDILNGMNVVRGRADLLSADLDGEAGDHAATIAERSEDIVNMVEKIRSVLGTLSGARSDDIHPVGLADAVADASEVVASTDPSCSVTTEVADVDVVADDLLDDVLRNVFANAVEHGGSGTTIEATSTVAEDTVTLRIADDGRGIPPEKREAVLRRGETGATTGGTGFGLYFVDVMVDTYGGDVRITDSEAGGAAVELTLPLAN